MATLEVSPSTPTGLELKVQDALQGVQQVLPAKSTLQINNAKMTQAQMASQLNTYLTAYNAVAPAKSAYAEAVAARTAMQPAIREFLIQLRAALVALFGRGSPQLAKFGMSAQKPTPPSPTTAVLAAAQRQLTRVQRGTISKKQKQLITVVTPPQVTIGGSGKMVVLPPTINPAPGASVAAAVAATDPSGQAPADGTTPGSQAAAQPAATATK